MARSVTLKRGQFLLLLLSVLALGAAGGMFGAVLAWHVPQARNPAIALELFGAVVFVGLSIWKSVDDWTDKTSGGPPADA